MDALGYVAAVVVAAGLAVGGQYLITHRFAFGRDFLSLLVVAMLGVYGGSELFGEIGSIASLSEHGPAIGGFYLLTGLVGGAILAGAAVLGLRRAAAEKPTDMESQGIKDPKIAHFLFNDSRAAAIWLGIRLFVGYEWLAAGYHKVTDPAWMSGGSALKGYWTAAVAIPEEGKPAITYGWYREFLQTLLAHDAYTWFAKLVAVGEVLIGIGLIVGCLVGFAAFFGALMNFNFMLAGSASTNPVLFGLAVFLILAWKIAGYWGLDRYVLPMFGAPWQPGRVFHPQRGRAEAA